MYNKGEDELINDIICVLISHNRPGNMVVFVFIQGQICIS